MDARTRRTMQEMVSQLTEWVKTLARDSQEVRSVQQANQLERRVREEGLQMLGNMFEMLLQNALDHQPPERICPNCSRPRRHKGCRPRGLLSSIGAVRVSGIYWYCPYCGIPDHGLRRASLRREGARIGDGLGDYRGAETARRRQWLTIERR